jgi:hypothetical protein
MSAAVTQALDEVYGEEEAGRLPDEELAQVEDRMRLALGL